VALREVRIDDLTGEYGAEPCRLAVGDREWWLDLGEVSRKQLLELIRPYTDAAEAAAVGQPNSDGALPPLQLAHPDGGAGDGDDTSGGGGGAELTADERADCRLWAQQLPRRQLNRYEIEKPNDRGRLPEKVVDAWIAEGKPDPVR